MLGSHWLRDLGIIRAFGQHRRFCLGASWQAVAVLTGMATAFTLLVASSVLKLNLTESMPIGLYLLRGTTNVHVGDIVVACPPPAAQRIGMVNGYLARAYGVVPGSRCAAGSVPVLKYAIAIAGDIVVINERGLSLNGRLFDSRPQAQTDSRGRSIAALPYGQYHLGKGEIWLYSPARCSWDSSYFGPITTRDLQGTAEPIVTMGFVSSPHTGRASAAIRSQSVGGRHLLAPRAQESTPKHPTRLIMDQKPRSRVTDVMRSASSSCKYETSSICLYRMPYSR